MRFKGTSEQLVNALRSMPIRGGIAGQCVAETAADEIERLRDALEEIASYDTGATAGLAYTAKEALK